MYCVKDQRWIGEMTEIFNDADEPKYVRLLRKPTDKNNAEENKKEK